jgi:phage baseplate assembly protein V
MSTERMMGRMIAPALRRLQNIFARGTVALVNASTKMQVLQVKLLADETLDVIEHFEPYGYTSHPLPGAEVLTLSVDGDRSHTVVIVTADRRYRPTGLAAGDVAVYDHRGQSIRLTDAGIVIDCAGMPLQILNAPTVTHDGVDIGKTHTHGGVRSGSERTGNPA